MGAVEYAEVTLGVHSVYEKAEVCHGELVQRQLELEEAYRAKRSEAELLELRQYEVTVNLRARNPELSETAFNRELKGWLHVEPSLKKLRSDTRDATSRVEYAEHQVRAAEMNIKIQVARMHELGGYFEYLAAAKNAQEQKRTALADTSPWPS